MMKIIAAITGVEGWVPDYRLTNHELAKMVETTDEWIMQRIGIKERRILKGDGRGSSYMGARAVKGLLEKTNTSPDAVDLLVDVEDRGLHLPLHLLPGHEDAVERDPVAGGYLAGDVILDVCREPLGLLPPPEPLRVLLDLDLLGINI